MVSSHRPLNKVSMVRDVFFSLFLYVFLAVCLTCLHLRDISLLIMSALPLNYVLWLFWFHFTSCLDPILSFSDLMLQSVFLTMDNCPICNKRVLPHAKQVKCCLCHLIYHMKCLTLQTEDLLYIRSNSLTWFCKTCITKLFPFNHIEHDDVFVSEVNNIGSCTRSVETLSDLLFNPFELNSDDHYSPLIYIDPDMNYYNEIDSHIALNCNYYFEESISAAINDKIKTGNLNKVFSLCHVNIRSLKANLAAFEICLQNMNFKFSAIGISETWLRDCNYDLYNIEGYNFVEAHRPSKIGGGVGIFIRNDIPFQTRNDLNIYNGFFESVFIEINKTICNKKKKTSSLPSFIDPRVQIWNYSMMPFVNYWIQWNKKII